MHGYDFWATFILIYILVGYCLRRVRRYLLRRRKRPNLKQLEKRTRELEMKTGLVFDEYGNLQDGYDYQPWVDYLNTLPVAGPRRPKLVGATYKHKLPIPTSQRSPYGMATLITRRTPEDDKELRAFYLSQRRVRGVRGGNPDPPSPNPLGLDEPSQ